MTRHVALAVLLLPLLAACVPHADQPMRYVWPPTVEDAKIEYIRYYQVDQDVLRENESLLAQAVIGPPPNNPLFNQPQKIATLDGQVLYVSDSGDQQMHVLDLTGRRLDVFRSKESDEDSYRFGYPGGIAIAGDYVYVADTYFGLVLRFHNGKQDLDFGKGVLERPTGLAYDPLRKRLYVVETGAHRLAVFDEFHQLVTTIGERGRNPGQFNYPLDIDLDVDGNLYVLDSMNSRVQVLSPDGRPLRSFGERGTALGSFQVAKSIAVSRSGLVVVSDSLAHKFVIFNLKGEFLLTIGGKHSVASGTISPGGFYLPQGVAIDSGDGIWVVDSLNSMIHKFQYLNADFLLAHPLDQDEIYIPEELRRNFPPQSKGSSR